MYDGNNVTVDLRCDNSLMKSRIDRFGEDVKTLAYDMTFFRLVTEVSASQTFFGWVFGFCGKVQILAPAEVKEQYRQIITKSNLYNFYSFYKTYPDIFQTVSGKSSPLLSWSHYAILLQVKDKKARAWYEKEALKQTWGVRILQRNVSSQYYYCMLQTQKKELVKQEMEDLTAEYQSDKLEFIKNPVIAEFLGLSSNTDFPWNNRL